MHVCIRIIEPAQIMYVQKRALCSVAAFMCIKMSATTHTHTYACIHARTCTRITIQTGAHTHTYACIHAGDITNNLP